MVKFNTVKHVMMVLAQANRKHRNVLSPLNESVNIVALILYSVSSSLSC